MTSSLKNPILIIIRGVPGGGKSYLAKTLVDVLGKENTIVLDPDQVDQTSTEYTRYSQSLSEEGIDEKFHLYRFSRQQAYDAVPHKKIIIWNQGFIDFDGLSLTIKRIEDVASEHGLTLKTLVVDVEIDPEIAKSRIATRVQQGGHNVPDDALDRFVNQYRSFAGNGYPTVSVTGTDAVELSAEKVLASLTPLTQ
ncbi:MAG: ATP-binding protein [Candidatus Microsaccharimonas sp.]